MQKNHKFLKELRKKFKEVILYNNLPSQYLNELRKEGLIGYFPELNALIGVPQDPEWHPEGDVWLHTLKVIDNASRLKEILKTEVEKDIYMYAALCHDFGKPYTTVFEENHWRSSRHDTLGGIAVRRFLKKLAVSNKIIDEVIKYVTEHLRPSNLYKTKENVSLNAIKRLSERIDIDKLILLAKADHYGRDLPEEDEVFPEGQWLKQKYEESKRIIIYSESKPFLTGRYLISLNMQPGREMGRLIRESFELQKMGKLKSKEDAQNWAKQRLDEIKS